MIDQPPDQDLTPEYADYAPGPPSDAHFADLGGATPVAPPSPRWAEPSAPPADTFPQDAIALSQLLVAPLNPEHAIGQALVVGMRLAPAARQLTVYATQPSQADGLLRLAMVGRKARADESEVDLAPRSARTLGLGGAIDQQVLQERRAVGVPSATCMPLRVPNPEAERLVGALVVQWEGAAPTRTDIQALSLLAPCCATLVARREASATQRRLAASLALLPALRRHAPASYEPPKGGSEQLQPSAEELAVLRETAEALRRVVGARRALMLTLAAEGALRVHSEAAAGEEDTQDADARDGMVDAGLARRLLDAVGGDIALIGGRSPYATSLAALFGAAATQPAPAPCGFILLPIQVAGQIVALLALADPDADAGSAELAVAQAEAATAGATLQAMRLSRVVAAGDAARDAFLSLTVHELRSPLTAVKGYAQLMMRQARRLSVSAQMYQAIAAIEEQATRMADMISEMHDAVRIRRGDLELQLEPVELVPLVARALEQQRKLFPQHEIQLELQLEGSDDPLVGEWDPRRAEQVVAALVNNAARYMPSGGIIGVRISRRDADGAPEALICVRDAGIGIAGPDRERIFEYLYRSPEATRRHLSGLGLGLFVSRTLAERMGGRLWLAETQTGASSGSAFCFALPLSATR